MHTLFFFANAPKFVYYSIPVLEGKGVARIFPEFAEFCPNIAQILLKCSTLALFLGGGGGGHSALPTPPPV